VSRPLGGTRQLILDAARAGLLDAGYAGLSTRKVADRAGVPLSQLHYHFGGKRPLILAVLTQENERLLARQAQMYGEDRPLWQRYEQACDFLDEDIASGYVRVLQEMTAAGWTDDEIAVEVRAVLQRWVDLLTHVVGDAEDRGMQLGPFTAEHVATLLALMFLGGESLLLLGIDDGKAPVRESLQRVGELIRQVETRGTS
jgi:AcrR family transcriptional regulator